MLQAQIRSPDGNRIDDFLLKCCSRKSNSSVWIMIAPVEVDRCIVADRTCEFTLGDGQLGSNEPSASEP